MPVRFWVKVRFILFATASGCFTTPALALPTGAIVVSGSANFTMLGVNTLVVQASPGTVINWESFSIASGESVIFTQASAAAGVLNHVLGGQLSSILGNLTSNGEVSLVSPNGVLAETGSVINVGGLALTADNIALGGLIQTGGSVTLTASTNMQLTGTINAAGGSIIGGATPVINNTSGGTLIVTGGGAQGNISLSSGNAAFTPAITAGWNLLGNSLAGTLSVASMVGNPDTPIAGVSENVDSVWKWNSATARWAFYSPRLTAAELSEYAAAKGYDVLAAINPSEGFWINAGVSFSMPPQVGAPVDLDSSGFSNLPQGFNLISIGNQKTPSEFRASVGIFTSLWGWDPVEHEWYFYSPLLEALGGLAQVKAYAESHGYLHFSDHNRKLGVGIGFWVDK